jgi:hypothetical protein
MLCQWFGLKSTGTVFSGLASKPVATVSPSLASKPVVVVSSSLASKLVAQVSWFGPQNRQLWFGDLDIKFTAMVFWFWPQNQRMEYDAGHALRSGGLLRLEASRARVFQSGLKTDGGTTTGDAYSTIAEVTSGSS